MNANISFYSCLLGQFVTPIQTHFGTNSTIVFSLWEGSQLSEAELSSIQTNFFNGSSYDEGWALNATTGLPSMGRRELVRFVLTDVPRVVGGNELQRIFQFSKITEVVKPSSAGLAGLATLALTDGNLNASVVARRKANFLMFGSVGDMESDADVKVVDRNITLDSNMRLADIKFNFDFND